jgi:hypothetical protein
MLELTITPQTLVLLGAAALSLGFSYIPGLNVWFAKLSDEAKKLTMAGLVLLLCIIAFLLGCFGLANIGFACSVPGALNLLSVYVLALAANQGTYKVSPQVEAVKAVNLKELKASIKPK